MPDDAEAKPNVKGKHRKLTCAGCRRRKSKCDGKHPKCTTCIAYKDDCVYDKAPSLAYVRSLEDEVQELRNQLKAAKTQAWLNKGANNVVQEEQKIAPAPTSSSESPSVSRSTESRRNSTFLSRAARQVKWETDISVDDHGSVSFHGSTSAVHEPPVQVQQLNLSPPPFEPPSRFDDQRTKQDLVTNANKQKQLEGFGIANSAAKINLPKEISEELLKYHWCWIHPLFLFVYRPAFTRGMTLVNNSQPGAPDPPYFSETLLRVMHAHCARFLNHSVYQQIGMQAGQTSPQPLTAAEFMQNMTHEARVSLGMETLKPSAIPTIQALLQQSAREIVFGRSSQGWLYGGMAFRMASDMGIHLPTDKLQTIVKSLSAEDVEIRKRLFWSCYSWDKILSLYLGRMPGFTPAIDDVPLSFMDDYSDSDLWYPYYGETPGAEISSNPTYTPCPGYVVTCFQHLCKLTIILSDLLQSIYSSEAARKIDEDQLAGGRTPIESPFVRITRDLQHWWASLPVHLKIRPDQMPTLAPPVHIMSLNLLYHTTLILLNRPVLLGSHDDNAVVPARSYQTCLSATAAIHDLLLLQANTFGLSHVSYLNAYCAYTAATVAVLRFERELKPGEDHAATLSNIGLNMLLEVLQRTSAAMPALERSYNIIRKRISAVVERYQQHHPRTFLPSPSSTSTPMPSVTTSNTTQNILSQSTGFQPITNTSLMQSGFHNQGQSSPPDPASSFVTSTTLPLQWQSDMRSTLPLETGMSQSNFADDWLPAFPGQQFPVGSEHSFGSNEVESQSRMALLGFNLDPHARLNPGDIDWTMMEGFDGSTADIKFQPNAM